MSKDIHSVLTVSFPRDDDNNHCYNIIVKVHKTLCELSDVLSPWWYELQVIEDLKSSVPGSVVPPSSATGASAGEFKTVPSKTEIKFCKDNSVGTYSI